MGFVEGAPLAGGLDAGGGLMGAGLLGAGDGLKPVAGA